MSRPNVLFLMVDELRSPQHENEEITKWRKENFKTQTYMEEHGINFTKNYTACTACAPSRTSLFTGQYSSLHGVANTPGAAKADEDPDMFWLTPNSVPTMGEYFSSASYNCYYKGKWHISNADLFVPGTWNPVVSYDNQGYPDPENTKKYLDADKLKPFGFHGYVGPTPDTADSMRSGSSSIKEVSGRDIIFTKDAINILKDLNESNDTKPWFLVCSLTNPHDITLYGDLTSRNGNYNFVIDPSVPNIPQSPTANEDLSTKPKCQQYYKIRYQNGFQPTSDTDDYRRLYYSLTLKSEKNHQKVIEQLKKTKFYDNTIIVYISDHGEELGAHSLFQKWYSAYEESIHVPFYIKIPKTLRTQNSLPKGTKVNLITSNVDVFPTLLGLCNIDEKKCLSIFKKTHTDARRLVGRDLSRLILNGEKLENKPVLFITNDNPFNGGNMTTVTGRSYIEIPQPTNIQTVITYLTDNKGNKELWKYSRYYDDPKYWSTPFIQNKTQVKNKEIDEDPGRNTRYQVIKNSIISLIKDTPNDEEFEMYNLTKDPFEQYNLCNEKYSTSKSNKIQSYLNKVLIKETRLKLLEPKINKTSNNTPFTPNQRTTAMLPKVNFGT